MTFISSWDVKKATVKLPPFGLSFEFVRLGGSSSCVACGGNSITMGLSMSRRCSLTTSERFSERRIFATQTVLFRMATIREMVPSCPNEDLKAELERLRQENAALKKGAATRGSIACAREGSAPNHYFRLNLRHDHHKRFGEYDESSVELKWQIATLFNHTACNSTLHISVPLPALL